MFAVTPDRVRKDIAAVRALSQFNEQIRSHFSDEKDLSGEAQKLGATSYIEARRYIAEPLQWKVFSHCASVTRLYALYEGFVYELISAWLKMVPALYGSYERLPDVIIKQHRVGVGVLLQKWGAGARTEHLTELSIVQALYLARSGDKNFELIADAFFIDLRNLRHQELCSLFTRVSIENLGNWLEGHSELKALCDAAGTTVAGRLNELVEYRNEASHARDEIDETLGVTAFEQIAEFIQALCAALQQFVALRNIDLLQQSGRLEPLGAVTEYFRKPDAAILTTAGAITLAINDEIVGLGTHKYIDARILTLQDHGEDVAAISTMAGAEIGLRSEPSLAKGLHVFRVLPPKAEEVPEANAVAPAALPQVADKTPDIPGGPQPERSGAKAPWWKKLADWLGKGRS